MEIKIKVPQPTCQCSVTGALKTSSKSLCGDAGRFAWNLNETDNITQSVSFLHMLNLWFCFSYYTILFSSIFLFSFFGGGVSKKNPISLLKVVLLSTYVQICTFSFYKHFINDLC